MNRQRRLAVGRLQKLERMGLVTAAGPGQWMIGLEAGPVLRDVGMRAVPSSSTS
jgi:type IV secretory pathway VirD2 relaxase